MKRIRKLCMLFGVYLIASNVYPEDHLASTEAGLRGVFGDKKVEVRPYDDLLNEVLVDSRLYFATHDGRYLFSGGVIDTHRRVDLMVERENQSRQSILTSQDSKIFVHYPAQDTKEFEVTVFTDIDCPYCRKFHSGMSDLNKSGVHVKYVMIPRAGIASTSYEKTLSALCSANPAESVTQAMQNQDQIMTRCDPQQLNSQMALARVLKINSTPTIVLPDGELHVGFLNTDQLLALLKKEAN